MTARVSRWVRRRWPFTQLRAEAAMYRTKSRAHARRAQEDADAHADL